MFWADLAGLLALLALGRVLFLLFACAMRRCLWCGGTGKWQARSKLRVFAVLVAALAAGVEAAGLPWKGWIITGLAVLVAAALVLFRRCLRCKGAGEHFRLGVRRVRICRVAVRHAIRELFELWREAR